MKRNQSQLNIIKRVLLSEGIISRNQCLRDFFITRLSAYIQDLEELGWVFEAKHLKKDYVYVLKNTPLSQKVWRVNGIEVARSWQ